MKLFIMSVIVAVSVFADCQEVQVIDPDTGIVTVLIICD